MIFKKKKPEETKSEEPTPEPKPEIKISPDEVMGALWIVSFLDPDDYPHAKAKGLIYKLQDARETEATAVIYMN